MRGGSRELHDLHPTCDPGSPKPLALQIPPTRAPKDHRNIGTPPNIPEGEILYAYNPSTGIINGTTIKEFFLLAQ